MKRSTSRLLSTMLVLCMVLALLPGTALAEGNTVYAGTVEEFLAALAPQTSDVTVVLEGKDYTVDGSVYLHGLENVTIRGTTGTRIMSTSPASVVITLIGCSNIVLDNLVIGHDLPASSPGCESGVVSADGTEQLTITNCDIFGCGLVGIDANGSTGTVENSTIRDCSMDIMEINYTNMVFNNCIFSGNGYNKPGKYAINSYDMSNSELAFYNCTFSDNKNPRFASGSLVVENCTFTNNTWETMIAYPATGGGIYFDPMTGTIIDCDSDVTAAVIPGAVNGVAVTSIGAGAFGYCSGLTSVTIPDSVTSIGEFAFGYFSSLTDVYYGGSEEQWNQIEIDNTWDGNDALLNATKHYNSTGPDAPKAVLSPQKLKVNGEEKACEKYNINDENYFKLRDLAYMLGGTGSKFSVDYDYASQMITIRMGQSYTPIGTELDDIADRSETVVDSFQEIFIDGEKVSLKAYNIGGFNFFRLCDLGPILNFEVDFDWDTNTAIVKSK